MPSLTRENIKQHCRTCLRRLKFEDINSAGSLSSSHDQVKNSKEICVNIGNNEEIKQLISTYTEESEANNEPRVNLEDYTQYICIWCYNKLQSYEKFRKQVKQSAQKLQALLCHEVNKIEIGDDDETLGVDTDGMPMPMPDTTDLYKLLVKDGLMEPETVMLDQVNSSNPTNNDTTFPDPFDTAMSTLLNDSGSSEDDWPDFDRDDAPYTESSDDEDLFSLKKKRNTKKVSDDEEFLFSPKKKRNTKKVSDGEPLLFSPKKKHNTKKVSDDEEDLFSLKKKRNTKKVSDDEEDLFSLKKRITKVSTRSMRSDNKPLNKPKTIKNEKPTEPTQNSSNKEEEEEEGEEEEEDEEWGQEEVKTEQPRIKRIPKVPTRRNRGTKNSLKCEQCGKRFSHKITLEGHIRQVHEGCKRPFKCDRCDNSYALLGGLYTHMKEIHEAEVRSYTCGIDGCENTYTNSKSMERHKRVKHCDTPVVRKYVCEQCGATFNQTANLRYHRRTKHPTEAQQAEKAKKEENKERFECEHCKKLFHSRYTLKYHTLQFHDKQMNYECNVCGKKVALKFMLDQHMLVHSTTKIPCELCGKAFVRKFELDKHIKAVHMKLKPFQCQYCHESFAIRKTLKHHEYTHTGEKPYVCDVCGQAYRQQSCLKNHRKSAHGLVGRIPPNEAHGILSGGLRISSESNGILSGGVTINHMDEVNNKSHGVLSVGDSTSHGILSGGESTNNSVHNTYFTAPATTIVDCSKTTVVVSNVVPTLTDGSIVLVKF